MDKKVLYIDMDGVLVDFQSGVEKVRTPETDSQPDYRYDAVPGIFSLMVPMPGALEAFATLAEHFNTFIGHGNFDNSIVFGRE